MGPVDSFVLLRTLNRVSWVLVALSLGLAVVGTEPGVRLYHMEVLSKLDSFVFCCFGLEYVVRGVLKVVESRGSKGVAVVRYVFSAGSVVDLVAMLPSAIGVFHPEFYALRAIRLVRFCRVSRSSLFMGAVWGFCRAIGSRRRDLSVSFVYTALVLFLSSIAMYVSEGSAQPEYFGSLLRSLWWSVATVTAVGYGDVTPVTVAGRFVAAVTALVGISVIAIPIGIFSSAFSDVVKKEGRKEGGSIVVK